MAKAITAGFTGAYQDSVTSAYPLGNGYRWYMAGQMRFNAPDSLSPFGGGGINPDVYCAADPINGSDPSGHMLASLEEDIGQAVSRTVGDMVSAVSGSRSKTAQSISALYAKNRNWETPRWDELDTTAPIRRIGPSRRPARWAPYPSAPRAERSESSDMTEISYEFPQVPADATMEQLAQQTIFYTEQAKEFTQLARLRESALMMTGLPGEIAPRDAGMPGVMPYVPVTMSNDGVFIADAGIADRLRAIHQMVSIANQSTGAAWDRLYAMHSEYRRLLRAGRRDLATQVKRQHDAVRPDFDEARAYLAGIESLPPPDALPGS